MARCAILGVLPTKVHSSMAVVMAVSSLPTMRRILQPVVNRKGGAYDTVAYSCNHFRTPSVYANPSFCDANDDNDGIFDSRGFTVIDSYS